MSYAYIHVVCLKMEIEKVQTDQKSTPEKQLFFLELCCICFVCFCLDFLAFRSYRRKKESSN